MNTRINPAYADNLSYWLAHHKDYAAHVRQDRDASTGPQTYPEQLTTARHGHFLRCPLEDQTLWGFASDLHAERFLADFGGELLPPTA